MADVDATRLKVEATRKRSEKWKKERPDYPIINCTSSFIGISINTLRSSPTLTQEINMDNIMLAQLMKDMQGEKQQWKVNHADMTLTDSCITLNVIDTCIGR